MDHQREPPCCGGGSGLGTDLLPPLVTPVNLEPGKNCRTQVPSPTWMALVRVPSGLCAAAGVDGALVLIQLEEIH